MKAASRASSRTALEHGMEVFSVRWGYAGLIEGKFQPLNARSVGRITLQGGTILGCTRRPEFRTEEGRLLANRLGAGDVTAVFRQEHGMLVGLLAGRVVTAPLVEVTGIQKPIHLELFELNRI